MTKSETNTLKDVLRILVEAHLEFAGYRDSNGEYIVGPVQNSNIDPVMAQRMRTLAAALDPLRGAIDQLR
jgi:hypothetical protein